MKKMFVAFGIAIALICGIFVGANIQMQSEPEEPDITNMLVAEASDWIAEEHPEYEVENVVLKRIEQDDNYGGYRADYAYTHDGGTWGFVSLNIDCLEF